MDDETLTLTVGMEDASRIVAALSIRECELRIYAMKTTGNGKDLMNREAEALARIRIKMESKNL
jgi:hypothetical protein